MVEIYQRHMAGGTGHEHIDSVKWRNNYTGAIGEATRQAMVDFIDPPSMGIAYVAGTNGAQDIGVRTVHPTYGAAYIQTHSDGRWTNNLLSLPEY